MESRVFNEEMVREKLALIIWEIGKIKIADDKASLFSFQYNLTTETLIYILLRASKEFGFEINDEFVGSLDNYSFHSIMSSVMGQLS